MAIYEIRIPTQAAASGAAYTLLRAGSRLVRLLELRFTQTQATASNIGLAAALTLGTPTTTSLAKGRNPDDVASLAGFDLGWSVVPTIAVTPYYYRGDTIAGVVGNGIQWTWAADKPLILLPSTGLLLWNFGAGAGGIMNANAVFDE